MLPVGSGRAPRPGPIAPRDRALHYEKLLDMTLVPVCSPALAEQLGGLKSPRSLLTAPLVYDDSISSRANLPEWSDWLRAAGVNGVDLTRGLRFNAADHSLDAAVEGAGILLTQAILALRPTFTFRSRKNKNGARRRRFALEHPSIRQRGPSSPLSSP